MARPVVQWHGRRLAILPSPPQRVRFVRVGGDADAVALQVIGERPLAVAPNDRGDFDPLRSTGALTTSATLERQLEAEGIDVSAATREQAREAARRLGPPVGEREVSLAIASAMLARARRDPMERLIALAREEERLERALGREVNAEEEFLGGGTETDLVDAVRRFRDAYMQHHAAVEREVDREVRHVAPTLAMVTGSKVAARLLAAANGLSSVARMPAGRLQLLGARRRPAKGPGPRHGLLYRAVGMDQVPWSKRGAYARSVAASAVIAARIDLAGVSTGQGVRLAKRLERRRVALGRERREPPR